MADTTPTGAEHRDAQRAKVDEAQRIAAAQQRAHEDEQQRQDDGAKGGQGNG